jgi:hypothetical protein
VGAFAAKAPRARSPSVSRFAPDQITSAASDVSTHAWKYRAMGNQVVFEAAGRQQPLSEEEKRERIPVFEQFSGAVWSPSRRRDIMSISPAF